MGVDVVNGRIARASIMPALEVSDGRPAIVDLKFSRLDRHEFPFSQWIPPSSLERSSE
jgi:hypothetical protein